MDANLAALHRYSRRQHLQRAENRVYAARVRWTTPNTTWNQRRPWRSTGFLSLFAKKKEVFRISARGRPIRCIKRITQKAISDGFATDIF